MAREASRADTKENSPTGSSVQSSSTEIVLPLKPLSAQDATKTVGVFVHGIDGDVASVTHSSLFLLFSSDLVLSFSQLSKVFFTVS